MAKRQLGSERHPFRLRNRAAGRQAGLRRRRVPFGRPPLRPDERPDVGRAASRLEGRAGHRGQSAQGRRRDFALLDLAGGTGDVAFRVVKAGGAGRARHRLRHQCRHARVGRERAHERGLDDAVTFEQGNAEELPYPDRSFDCVTIAFGIRNVPRIDRALGEAFRVLKIGGRFLCLEFSTVDLPGLDALYELYSFQVIPRIGEAVTGDREAYQYLVESIRKFPKPEGLRRDDRAAGFRRVSFTPMTGGVVALHSGWKL